MTSSGRGTSIRAARKSSRRTASISRSASSVRLAGTREQWRTAASGAKRVTITPGERLTFGAHTHMPTTRWK
jgi:hypothetical protein